MNIGYLCTGLQCERGRADKVAMRWIDARLQRTDYTFAQLDAMSNQVANALRELGVSAGDVVSLLLPKTPELFACFLGILKCQATANCLFTGFGTNALHARLSDSAAKVLVSKSSLYRRISDLRDQLPHLQNVILTDLPEHEGPGLLAYGPLIATQPAAFAVPATDPMALAVLHYTSGSTGKPKGVLHVHNIVRHLERVVEEVFQIEEDDVYWCTADQGWIAGITSGLIAPWSEGATVVQYAGGFDADSWYRLLEQQRVTIWNTAPTALRMLMQSGARAEDYDFGALKRIYTSGEPLNPDVIAWVRRRMQREVYDAWAQTETGGLMIANRPGMRVKHGSMGRPLSDVAPTIAGANRPGEIGPLSVRAGWDSMFVGYLNMEEAYRARFQDGLYNTGDLAYQDGDGYFWFVGRNDDVINTSGHLVSPFEIESALLERPEIIDAAVIGAPDGISHEKVVAFITLDESCAWTKSLEVKLRVHVSNRVSSVATPAEFVVTPRIPKTHSGKILRRALRARYLGENMGDVSTMEDGW